MSAAAIVTVATFMTAMGLLAIATPTRFLRFVGSETLGREGRNEVRAVYGGFGIMMGGILLFALQQTDYRSGILLCMGLALVGMSLGRVVSVILDRAITPMIVVGAVGEMVGGSVLILAI
jgi:hypothetical protein